MKNLRPLHELCAEWRRDADRFRTLGQEPAALMSEAHAEELETQVREWELAALTLEEASRETGLAYDTVQRKVSSGEWRNVGQKGAPRVRRCDVYPGLRGTPRPVREDGAPDVAEEVLLRRLAR